MDQWAKVKGPSWIQTNSFRKKEKKKQELGDCKDCKRHSSWVRNADSHHPTVFLEMGATPNSVNSSEACCMSQHAAKIHQCYFENCPNLIRLVKTHISTNGCQNVPDDSL
jgi:hypothetical protein